MKNPTSNASPPVRRFNFPSKVVPHRVDLQATELPSVKLTGQVGDFRLDLRHNKLSQTKSRKLYATNNVTLVEWSCELDQRYLVGQAELQPLADAGIAYVVVVVNNRVELGFEWLKMAHSKAGFVLPFPKDHPFHGKCWFLQGYGKAEGGIKVFATLTDLPAGLWQYCGVQVDETRLNDVLKRMRRANLMGKLGVLGSIVREEKADFYFNAAPQGEAGVNTRIDATSIHIEMDSISQPDGRIIKAPTTRLMKVLLLKPDEDTPEGLALTKLFSGASILNTAEMNDMLGWIPDYQPLRPLDGLRTTLLWNPGQIKGHTVCMPDGIMQDTLIVMEPKGSWRRKNNRVRFTILDSLKRPAEVNMSGQTATVLNFADGNLLKALGFTGVDGLFTQLHDPVARANKFDANAVIESDVEDTEFEKEDKQAIAPQTPWTTRDALNAGRDGFVNKATGKRYSYLEVNPLTGKDIVGGACISNQPRVLQRILFATTQTMNKVDRGRFQLAKDVAVSAYAMFDLSIMEHSDPLLRGRGFYLNRGLLKHGTAVVHHKIEHGFYGIPFEGQLETEAAISRDPIGSISAAVQGLKLVYNSWYEGNVNSCFAFISCALLPSTPGELWRQIYLAAILDQMDGADLDDLLKFWICQLVLAHIAQQSQGTVPRSSVVLPAKLQKQEAVVVSVNPFDAFIAKKPAELLSMDEQYFEVIKPESVRMPQVVNMCLIIQQALQNKLPLPAVCVEFLKLAYFQEEVIDAGKLGKGLFANMGSIIDGMLREAQLAIPGMGKRFFRDKFPKYMLEERKKKGFDAPIIIDAAYDGNLDDVQVRLYHLIAHFRGIYLNTSEYRMLNYMREYQFHYREQAVGLAQRLRASYGRLIGDSIAAEEELLTAAEFEDVTKKLKDAYVVSESLKSAGREVWDNFTSKYLDNPILLEETMIALSQDIYSGEPVREQQPDELGNPVWKLHPDTLLYEVNHFQLYLRGLRRAKVQYMNLCEGIPIDWEHPEHISLEPIVRAYRGLNHGIAKVALPSESLKVIDIAWLSDKALDREKWNRALEFAQSSPVIDIHRCHPQHRQHMERLWNAFPHLRGKKQDALVFSTPEFGVIGYASASDISTFDYYTRNGSKARGVLKSGDSASLKCYLLPYEPVLPASKVVLPLAAVAAAPAAVNTAATVFTAEAEAPRNEITFPLVKGWAKGDPIDQDRVMAFAKTCPTVDVLELDPKNDAHMHRLWQLRPELKDKREAVILATHKASDFRAYLLKKDRPAFLALAEGAIRKQGVLTLTSAKKLAITFRVK